MPAAAEDWTVVRSKTRRSRRGQGSTSTSDPFSQPSRSVPNLTKEEIQKDFDNFNAQFQTSPGAASLRDTITEFVSDALDVGNDRPVTQAISLGIGSFDPTDGSWQLKRRAHTQLAAMLFMVRLLEEKTSSGPIKCIFQEPIFTSGDLAFLTAMGHEVVDSPVASNSVNAGTLFFGPHLYKEVYGKALKGELPSVWVGTDWVVWSKTFISPSKEEEEHLLAIKKMHETYKHVTFPEDDKDSTIFYATSLYLRYPENQAVASVEEVAAAEMNYVEVKDEIKEESSGTRNGKVKEEPAETKYIKAKDEPTETNNVRAKQKPIKTYSLKAKQKPIPERYNFRGKREPTAKDDVEIKEEPTETNDVEIKEEAAETNYVEIKDEPAETNDVEIKDEPAETKYVEVKDEPSETYNFGAKQETTETDDVKVKEESTETSYAGVKRERSETIYAGVKRESSEMYSIRAKREPSETHQVYIKEESVDWYDIYIKEEPVD
ncbi:SRR1 domain-containing protein [Trichoderma simmonsii]|uniref:SRR1 domain-containing protein n=1 Tax=Trichoderma simmonsii TaxID=1491479 RepID=A0A8G0L2J0_9HYPO|nr:SRR1 domain-containing protein [Trichoderma simmonsii]